MRCGGLAAPLASRCVHPAAALVFGLAPIAAERVVPPAALSSALAAVPAEPAVPAASDLGLIVVARAPAAAGLVSAFGLAAVAEPVVAVAFGLALIFVELVLAASLAFFPVAFHVDRSFSLPAFLAVRRPLC